VGDSNLSIIELLVFPLLPEMQQKLQTKFLYNGLPEILGEGMCTYLHPALGANEVHGLGMAACHCYVL
jgi:hypothetical protein